MNDKDNKTRVGSGWDFSDDVPDNKNKSNDRDTFTHFIMGAYGFGKQGDDEAAQTCIDEALEWFDTICAQRVREAVEKERERIKQATVGHWVDDWLARKDFEEALTQQDNH